MTGGDLTPDQARRLADKAGEMQEWLGRLRTRMERLHFRYDDPLYRDVVEAFNALMALRMNCHYLGCGMKGWGDEPPTPAN